MKTFMNHNKEEKGKYQHSRALATIKIVHKQGCPAIFFIIAMLMP